MFSTFALAVTACGHDCSVGDPLPAGASVGGTAMAPPRGPHGERGSPESIALRPAGLEGNLHAWPRGKFIIGQHRAGQEAGREVSVLLGGRQPPPEAGMGLEWGEGADRSRHSVGTSVGLSGTRPWDGRPAGPSRHGQTWQDARGPGSGTVPCAHFLSASHVVSVVTREAVPAGKALCSQPAAPLGWGASGHSRKVGKSVST